MITDIEIRIAFIVIFGLIAGLCFLDYCKTKQIEMLAEIVFDLLDKDAEKEKEDTDSNEDDQESNT